MIKLNMSMAKVLPGLFKTISLGMITWTFCLSSFSQYRSNLPSLQKLLSIEAATNMPYEDKSKLVRILKKQFELQQLSKDSVYARILHKLALFEYLSNNQIANKDALLFTHEAIRINSSGRKDNSAALCVNSYTNLGLFYESLRKYNVASEYYDSAISFRRRFYEPRLTEPQLLLDKARMLLLTGDYQKAVEDMNVAIQKAKEENDLSILQHLFNQRAQSYLMQGQLDEALRDVMLAGDFSKQNNITETLNGLMIKARALAGKKDFSHALILFNKAIKQRIGTQDYYRIARDYTDLGNFYLNDLHEYKRAKECYLKTVRYAKIANDYETLSKAYNNLEYFSFKQNNFKDAEYYSMASLRFLQVSPGSNFLINPSANALNAVGNKELIFAILANKAELLLQQFKETGHNKYIAACMQTALLTEGLVTKMRHEQLGEQSKLYWRNRTRNFFALAMEACYLSANTPLAFYFMEKSRAVLLNDKLNELGASAHLPQAEAVKEHEFQIAVLTEQQKQLSFIDKAPLNDTLSSNLSRAKANLEHYIKSLEKKFPIYYQYKYADEVSPIQTLQMHLKDTRQSFVHYFINDTVAYVLGITATHTKMVKLSNDDFNIDMLLNFLKICSYEPASNTAFMSFVSSSYSLYKLLFQPLAMPPGRVIICTDNLLIPFEGLCTDLSGNNFLINEYIFSYVYSARSILTQYNLSPSAGDFIGFAPVSFMAYDNILDLRPSADAIKKCAIYYSRRKIVINEHASRSNFIGSFSRYSIATVFSHANADSTEIEPLLFMHDSVIRLSELQLLHKPATRLVILSACQTNVGKNEKGEGVFSLARGFASAGIPAVAATLWKADERAIYAISEKFHEFLSQGMPKDEALQKAKLDFINHGTYDKPFPYYWANMILMGNMEPVKLSGSPVFWWIGGIIFLAAAILLAIRFLRTSQ